MKNVKTIVINIANEGKLATIQNTRAFHDYLPNPNALVVGDNIVKVNHRCFRNLLDNQLFGMAKVTEYQIQ